MNKLEYNVRAFFRGEGVMQTRTSDRVIGILYTAILVGVAVFMFMHVAPLNLPFSSPDPPIDFEDGWMTEDGQEISLKQLYNAADEPNEPIVLTKQLPGQFYNDSYLSFISGNVDLTAKMDDKIIYSYSGTDPLGYPGTEAYVHHIRMDKSYADQTLTLIVMPAYTDASSYLDDLVICSVNDFTLYLIQNYGMAFFMSLTIIFMGFLMIIQFFFVPREYHAYNTFALGIASIAIGIWCAIETHLPMLLFGKLTMYLIMLDNVIMYFMVSPLIVFFSSAMSHRSRVIERISFAASVIAFLFFAYSTMYGGVPIIKSTYIFYALFAFTIVLGVVAGIRSAILVHRDPSSKRIDRSTLIAVFICAFTLFAYFIVYLMSSRVDVDSIEILRIGFIATQVVLLVGFMRKGNDNTRAAAESEAMRKLAYVDALTGIGNRAAFDIACDKLEDQKKNENFDFMLVCFDVDDLKRINDTYGHEFGDKHLIAASSMLVEAFGDIGDLFRIGGDEFSMFVSGKANPKQLFAERLEKLRLLEEAYNKEHPDKGVRISSGTFCLSETEDRTIREVMTAADEAMYIDKISHKKEQQ